MSRQPWSTIMRPAFVIFIFLGGEAFCEVEWRVDPKFAFTADATGFLAPTGIAFLNNPHTDPDATLYIVAELRGDIKSVSKNRQVRLFAKTPRMFVPDKELPDLSGEIGQIGTCFDDEDARLYTTSITVKGNTRINRIVSWKNSARVPWQSGDMEKEFTEIFEIIPTNNPHQIGFCFIGSDKKLWVATGDGAHHRTTHLIDYPNGKLLRFNLDLSAPNDNPYYISSKPASIQNYVYASGFRNPFAIAEVGSAQIFLADNGPNIDRLLMIARGKDYPWDGTSNESMIYGNALTWPKSIGPAGMIYVKEGTKGLEDLGRHLVIAGSYEGVIYALPVDEKAGVTGPPRRIVERSAGYRGALTGVALGPDGIYVAHIDIKPAGGFNTSAIYKLVHNASPKVAEPDSGPRTFDQLGCRGCHMLGGHGSPMAPPLDTISERVRERLKKQASPKDMNERIKHWIETKIRQPRFEDPNAAMPDFGISAAQAALLADFLIEQGKEENREKVKEESFFERFKWQMNQNIKYLLPVVFIAGFLLGYVIKRKKRKKRVAA